MHRYQICVALDERFGPNDVSLDVRTDQQHPLLKHEMQITTSSHGRAVLMLTFTAVDLWSAILTGMALVRQSGYVPVAVQARATTRREVAVRDVRSSPPPAMDRRSCGGPKADESRLGHIARPSHRHESDEDTDAVGGWG